MVAYVDSSAAVKLAHREEHSVALASWLNRQPDLVLISSVLLEIEVARALRRNDPAALPRVEAVLARLVTVEIDRAVRAIAASYRHEGLRSLDAIHLATAQCVSAAAGNQVDAFVAYDDRLLEFAHLEGLAVVRPM